MKNNRGYYLLYNPFEVLLDLNGDIPVASVPVFSITEKKPMFKIIDNDLFIYIREFSLKISCKDKNYIMENRKTGEKSYGQLKSLFFDHYNYKKGLIQSRYNFLNQEYSKKSDIYINYKYKTYTNYNQALMARLKEFGYMDTESDNIKKCNNILNWISRHTIHNGNKSLDCNGKKMLQLINLNKDRKMILNCRGKAKMAHELLMMEGIKSRIIFCKQYELDALNDHVVVIAYIEEFKKWIMLDPTYNLTIKSASEEFLSLQEIRFYLANQKEDMLILSKNANYNGIKLNKMIYLREMLRSLYKFTTTISNYPGCDINKNLIGLSPNVDCINNIIYIDNPDTFWS